MAEKRRRPTRAELDERIRSALGRIATSADDHPKSDSAAARAGAEPARWRVVNGTVTATHDV